MLAVRGFRGLAGRSFSWLPARDIASPVARCSGAATPDYIFDADETNFEALVLKAAKPVIVQMHATWCGPCQMLKPWLDEVVREMDGKVGARERGGGRTRRWARAAAPSSAHALGSQVLLARVDVDECPNLAQALRVTGYALRGRCHAALTSAHWWPGCPPSSALRTRPLRASLRGCAPRTRCPGSPATSSSTRRRASSSRPAYRT